MNMDLPQLQDFFQQAMPLLILCGGAVVCLLLESIWPRKIGNLVTCAGLATVLLSLFVAWGQWKSNFILPAVESPVLSMLKWDSLTLYFMLMTLMVGVITFLMIWSYVKTHPALASEITVLLLFSLFGMILMFASDHLLVSFLGLETMSLAVYVLVGSRKRDLKSNEAAIKYFIMGGVASAIFLYGMVFLYGRFETFHLSHFSVMTAQNSGEAYLYIGIALVLTGILFKIAVVPFHYWAPDVYEGAPAPITGFMAAGVKLAAFAFFIRLFLSMHHWVADAAAFMAPVGVATVVVGSLLAAVQTNLKRLLAYSSVSHAGFLLLAFQSDLISPSESTQGSQAMAFYLAAYVFMSLGAFAIVSQMTRDDGEATDLADLRGMWRNNPTMACLLAVFLFAMAGLPPLAGFIAKYGVIAVLINKAHYTLAIIAVLSSVVGAFFYLRPIVYMFFNEEESSHRTSDIPVPTVIAITICALLVVLLGVAPDVILDYSKLAVMALR